MEVCCYLCFLYTFTPISHYVWWFKEGKGKNYKFAGQSVDILSNEVAPEYHLSPHRLTAISTVIKINYF